MKPSMLAVAVLGFGLAAQAVAGSQSSSGFEVPSGERFAEALSQGAVPSPGSDEHVWADDREAAEGAGRERSAPLFQAIYTVLPAGSLEQRSPEEGDAGSIAARPAFFF